MRRLHSRQARLPMVLAAVAGSVILAAPPALAATGAHDGVTTFTKTDSCPTPPPAGGNIGNKLALSYEGVGALTSPAEVPVVVVFQTKAWWQGPPGTYAGDEAAPGGVCSGLGSAKILRGATITDAREGTPLDPNPLVVDQCTFKGGTYARDSSKPLPEVAVLTGGVCNPNSSLDGVVGPTVTNKGTGACVSGGPVRNFPLACAGGYTVS